MKFNSTCIGILLLTVLTAFSCTSRTRTVEAPAYGARLFSPIEIEKIGITDSSLVLSMKMFTPYIFGVNVDSCTYIQAGDRKYPILKAEGITLGQRNAKVDTFKLYFSAPDPSAKRIDLIDETAQGTKIWDIELKSGRAGQPVTLPESEGPAEFTLPIPEMKIGESKVNVHFKGYDERYGNDEVVIQVQEFISRTLTDVKRKLNEKGECSFDFTQYGLAKIYMSSPFYSCSFFMVPGETIDIYVNLPEVSRRVSPLQKARCEAVPQIAFTGKYARLNDLINNSPFDYPNDGVSIAGMDADTYFKYKTDRHKVLADSIRTLPYPEGYRQYLQIDNNMSLLEAVTYGPRLIWIAGLNQGKKDIKENDVVMKDEHFAILKEMNNEYLPYANGSEIRRALLTIGDPERIKKLTGSDKGPLIDQITLVPVFRKLENMETPDEKQYALLSSSGSPFYKEIFDHQTETVEKKLASVNQLENIRIHPTPEVKNENDLFKSIIDAYKGKVVFVDFWATWCGPCRNAMRLAEPVKEALKGKDVAYVYITGATSPKAVWIDMIPDIHGDHYYLTQEQWSQVCKQFDIKGIPYYKLIDKQGNTVLSQTGFMGADKMKKLIEKEL